MTELTRLQLADFNFLTMTISEYAGPVWQQNLRLVREAHLHIFRREIDELCLTLRVVHYPSTAQCYDEITLIVHGNHTATGEYANIEATSQVSGYVLKAKNDWPKKYHYDHTEIHRAAKNLLSVPGGNGVDVHVESYYTMGGGIICRFVPPNKPTKYPINDLWIFKGIELDLTKPKVDDPVISLDLNLEKG